MLAGGRSFTARPLFGGIKVKGRARPGRGRRFRSGHEQGFGVLLGDHQELERGLPRAAGALLPTAHGIGAHVQEGGEERLAGIEGQADARSPDSFAGANTIMATPMMASTTTPPSR